MTPIFLDLSLSSFCLNYSEKIHPLSDTQCRTNVASGRHFPQIPYNAHSACKESNEERKKSPKMFCKVESYCHLGNVRGQGWDQLLMICDIIYIFECVNISKLN